MRIQVAGDNKFNQKLFKRILETAGYTVDMVDNGRDSVAQVEQVRHLVRRLEENLMQFECY